ncbi:putative eukaryotic initiation factor-3, delta subunit [Cardiosporidium cionae]|uniref:Eukaryotic translation initiation factor 3 subunit I n=1 Tax=Cardiosporidium cionae TaxID=476202 RepID=A0ABQ7JA83_9APIC|nr:putative eukaryotic initiation factor-3, delta subunit [Cardiosporidium cionae]|eukprot:KAF8820848.1 putative eukaryotic initiation factor-3, delta subunit [Cardiosporidium cionae]
MRPFYLLGHERPLTSVVFNRDGDLLFSAGKDACLSVWWTNRGELAGTYPCGKGVVSNAECSLDSRMLIASSLDQKVLIFDVETGAVRNELNLSGPCKYVEWCRKPGAQSKFALVHDSFSQNEKGIEVYDYSSSDPILLWAQDKYTSRCTRVHWGPFDEAIISCHEDGNIMIWDAYTGEFLREFSAHSENITSASLSDDRALMLSCSSDGSAKLWDTINFNVLKSYKTDRPLNACDISPSYNKKDDSRRCHVLLGGGQKAEDVTSTAATEGKFQALIYHMVRAEELGSCRGHFGPINSLQWMPDGGGYASGGEDGYVRIYKFDDVYFTDKFK